MPHLSKVVYESSCLLIVKYLLPHGMPHHHVVRLEVVILVAKVRAFFIN
jgi:hypothetical protein